MWHVATAIDWQPEELDSGAGAGAGVEWNVVVYHGALQEKKLTWEEWNVASNHGHIKNKPTLPKVLKIPRELQEGKRLLQQQRCKNGGEKDGAATGASHSPQLTHGGQCTVASHGPQIAHGGQCTVASHGPQLANGGGQANVSFSSHHRCLV